MGDTHFTLGKISQPREMSENERTYLAAMIDGEGHITLVKTSQTLKQIPSYRLVVGVTNTDFGLLDHLLKMTGVGTLQQARKNHEKWKDCGHLMFNSEDAAFVLEQIRPHLFLKADRAEIALQFMALKRDDAYGNEDRAAQDVLYRKMRALNARGKVNQKPYTFTQPDKEQRSCTYEGCASIHYGHGYCRRHYKWVYESKTWTPETRRICVQCDGPIALERPITAKVCSVSCKMKWHRRHGAYTTEALSDAPKCGIDGCERPRQAQGICRRHYMQKWHADRKALQAPPA